MRKLLTHPILYAAILTAAVSICFGRTLGSYFLADDFGEVAYVSKIFEGDMARLWSNFTGNYMQVPSMAVYRPWLLMTLLIDYSVWKTNAFGFYLTNLLHYLVCTCLIFTLVRLLTDYWGKLRSHLAAIFSALIFAVHPLHCESVSWVVGRVDIVCLTYYLLGLVSTALYVRGRNRLFLALTVFSFWMAILTKEMAIALPVTASLMVLLWSRSSSWFIGSSQSQPSYMDDKIEKGPTKGGPPAGSQQAGSDSHQTAATLRQVETASVVSLDPSPSALSRVKLAMPMAIALFSSTVLYFIIRYASLGTITGGYTGSIGSSQFAGILAKWSDLDTAMRILFPVNQFVFGTGDAQRNTLLLIYFGLAVLTLARLLIGAIPRRWLVFIAISSLTALAPIYQLWGIGYDLEGSRFVFFLTVPLAMLLPIILFAPLKRTVPGQSSKASDENGTARRIMVGATILLALLCVAYAKITLRNNIPWVHAGKQTRALTVKAQELSSSTKPGRFVCVVGIPKDEGGAHMILNGNTFRNLITPPFAPKGLTGKILTFEPVLFGNPEKIDTRHFKEALRKPNVDAFLRWDMRAKNFVEFNPGSVVGEAQPLEIPLAAFATTQGTHAFYPFTSDRGTVKASAGGSKIEGTAAGLGVKLVGLDFKPSQFDYLALGLRTASKAILTGKECKVTFITQKGNRTAVRIKLTAERLTARASAEVNERAYEMRLPLSQYWRYFAYGDLRTIVVELPPSPHYTIDSIRLLPEGCIAPSVTVQENADSTSDGAYLVERKTDRVSLVIDGKKIAGTSKIELQILKKNFFFDNLEDSSALMNGIQKTIRLSGARQVVTLPAEALSQDGYVQARARCLDERNGQLGEFSFPVTFRVLAK